MDLICLLFLWVISFCLYKLNKHFWSLCKKECLRVSTNCFYVDLVFQIFRMRIVLFYILPAITRALFLWNNDLLDHVTPSEITVIYFFELLSHFIYYLVIYALLKRNRHDLSLIFDNNKLLNIFAVFTLILYCYFSITGFSLMGDAEEAPSDSLWMIKPLMIVVGSVTCFYIFVLGKKYWNKWLVGLAFITVLLYLIISFFSGIRGKLFWPILWMLYCVWIFRKDEIRKYSYFGVAILLFLALFQGAMTTFRSDKSADVSDAISALNKKSKKESRSLLNEVDYRFGALTRYSVGFLRMVDRGYYAGLNPIINSSYSPIPRRFFPDKPVPCSAEGDLYSMGMYLCSNEITKIETNMVEFSTAAHAYWELSFWGLVLFSIIPAIYVYFSIRLFRKFGLLGPCFFMAIMKPWGYNDPKIWVSDIVLQLSQVILISYILLVVYKKAKKVFLKKRTVSIDYRRFRT